MDTVLSFMEEEHLFLKTKPNAYLVDFLFKANSKGDVCILVLWINFDGWRW
jgi:hypothetical protein